MNISTIAQKEALWCYENRAQVVEAIQRGIDAATAESIAEIANLKEIARLKEEASRFPWELSGKVPWLQARVRELEELLPDAGYFTTVGVSRGPGSNQWTTFREKLSMALNRIEVKSCPPDTRSAATASVASPEPQPGSNAAPSEVPPSAEAAFRELKEWQLATFPDESPREVFNHLSEEIRELGQKLNDPAELADVLMLALCLCFRQGIDPVEAIRQKHAVNLQRRWEKTGAGFRHVKEPSAEAAIGEHMNPMSNTVRLQQNEIVTLRAEVDRLTKGSAATRDARITELTDELDRWKRFHASDEISSLNAAIKNRDAHIAKLRAEVERMTKERDYAIAESNRRDAKWMAGLDEIFGPNDWNAPISDPSPNTPERKWNRLKADRDRLAAELAAAKASVEAAYREGVQNNYMPASIDKLWLASDARRKLEGEK